jgi:hypothetical protein
MHLKTATVYFCHAARHLHRLAETRILRHSGETRTWSAPEDTLEPLPG